MKQWTGIAAGLLAALLCLSLFAGCSETDTESSSTTSSQTSSEESSQESEESEGEDDESQDLERQITYVTSASLVLDVYETDSQVQDYTDLGDVTLTDKEVNSTVTLDDSTTFQKVVDGELTSISQEDLAEGDMVAVTESDDGAQNIIVLELETEASGDETAEEAEESQEAESQDETESSAA